MKTPLDTFIDPADADLPLPELFAAYRDYLLGRERPARQATVTDYLRSLDYFSRSLVLHGKPAVLGQLTALNVRMWVADMRAGRTVVESHGSRNATAQAKPCTEYSIAPRHAALKAFTHKFVYRELKLTNRDLLGNVERFEPKQEATKERLNDTEVAAIRESFDSPSFESVRDRTIFEVHMATALRFETVLHLPVAALDRISGKVTVETKGGKVHRGRLDPKAMSHVRRYLRIRPETDCPELFVTGEGTRLGYWGGQDIWRRIQKRSGVKRLGSHLIRHTLAQHMAEQGAPIADIQDVLGHSSDKMARHYAGEARKRQAADIMAKYSLAS